LHPLLLADGWFIKIKKLLCSKNSLTKIVGYHQPTCLCVKMAFVVGARTVARNSSIAGFTFVQRGLTLKFDKNSTDL